MPDTFKAHLDLGQLYALKRPDWKEALAFWDTEIAKARVPTTSPVKQEELQVAMLVMDGPVWLKPTSPAAGAANDSRTSRSGRRSNFGFLAPVPSFG